MLKNKIEYAFNNKNKFIIFYYNLIKFYKINYKKI